MSRPAQSSFLDALTVAVVAEIAEQDANAPFQFVPGPECEPRTLDEVPLVLRLPGEDGYVELDRNFKPVRP